MMVVVAAALVEAEGVAVVDAVEAAPMVTRVSPHSLMLTYLMQHGLVVEAHTYSLTICC